MPKTPAQFEKIRIDRKAAILDAALHVFAEEGYHSASISKVSKYAGVSKGLMYNYFSSKEELLHELLNDIMHREVKILELLGNSVFSKSAIINLIDKTFALLAENPKLWKLYFVMSLQPEVLEIIMKKHAAIIMQFTNNLRAFFKQQFGKDAEVEMQYFNTIFSGMKLAFILDMENYPIEAMKKKLIEQYKLML